MQPTVFYRWQKEFFENGVAAFEQKRPSSHSADQERIAYLEKKLQTKDEVLAELMAEHVALKKRLANSDRRLSSAQHRRSTRDASPPRLMTLWTLKHQSTRCGARNGNRLPTLDTFRSFAS